MAKARDNSYTTMDIPQNRYNMDYITAAKAFDNPWTALGALVGNALTRNYMDRGEDKLRKSLEGTIPGTVSDAQLVQQQLANAPTQEQAVEQNLFNKYRQMNAVSAEPNYQVGLEALKNQSTSPLERAALQGAISGNEAQPASNITPQEVNGFQDYLQNNTPQMDAQGNLSNMGMADAVSAQKEQARQQILGQQQANGPQKFSVDDWKAQVWAEGKKQGRPDYQIQAVINQMLPQAEAAEKSYKDQMAQFHIDRIIANMPDSNGKGGDPRAVLAEIADLWSVAPEKAEIMAGGAITPQTAYNTEQQKESQQRQFDNSIKAADHTQGLNKDMARYENNLKWEDIYKKQQYYEAAGYSKKDAFLLAMGGSGSGKTASALLAKEQKETEEYNRVAKLRNDIIASLDGEDDYQEASINAIEKAMADEKFWKSLPWQIQEELAQRAQAIRAIRQARIGDYEGAKELADGLTPEYRAMYGLNEIRKNYRKK